MEELREKQKELGTEELAVRNRRVEVEQELDKFEVQIKTYKAKQIENNRRVS